MGKATANGEADLRVGGATANGKLKMGLWTSNEKGTRVFCFFLWDNGDNRQIKKGQKCF